MPLLSRKRTILGKLEVSYGVDPVPTGAANAVLVRNLEITPQESELVGRDLVRPYLGHSEQLPVSIHAVVSFEIEVAGSGAAGTPPAYGPFLRACGFSETISAGVSVTYAPVSNAFESITIYFNVDGVLHKMTGARGNVDVVLNAKQIPVFRFTFTGLYQTVVDAAAPTVTLTSWIKPVAVNTGNTTGLLIHGYALAVLSELSIGLGNEVTYRSLVGAESVLITDRKPSGNVTIEALAVSQKNWWNIAKNATLGDLSVTQGTLAGNRVRFDAPAVQIVKPTYADQDGIQMLQMGLTLVPGASGNDEFTIMVS